MTTTISAPTGQAVTVNAAALREWLSEPTFGGQSHAVWVGVGSAYTSAIGADFIEGLTGIFDEMANNPDAAARFWTYGEGVKAVTLFAQCEGDAAVGALIHVDLTNGLRLSSLPQEPAQFADTDDVGIIAAVYALAHIAAEANRLVSLYREATAPAWPQEWTPTTAAAYVGQLPSDVRELLAEAIRDHADAAHETQVIAAIREALTRHLVERGDGADIDARTDILGVVFLPDWFDNGYFFTQRGRVIYADGSHADLEVEEADEMFTELFGCVGERAGFAYSTRTGETEQVDFAEGELLPWLKGQAECESAVIEVKENVSDDEIKSIAMGFDAGV